MSIHRVYSLYTTHKTLIYSLLFLVVYSTTVVLAAPPTTPYYPTDNITDPTCSPTDTNCYVSVFPDQTSNTGKLLFTDGTNPTWASNLYWDETNDRLGIGTSSPQSSLHVDGDIIADNILDRGIEWTSRTSAADKTWRDVTYGNGIFVSVASGSTTDNIMISSDGINWTAYSASAASNLQNVVYGNGLFVAVSSSGGVVMTSPDGITWTQRTAAASNAWRAITYGEGLFVAVSNNGTGNQVMTSPDGITWTSRTNAADNAWVDITYGNGIFVALAQSTTIGDAVMTSPDGITWTIRTGIPDNVGWRSVTYANGLFVAVGENTIITSTDGITWTSRTPPNTNRWEEVEYGNGLFVAVAETGTGNRAMASPDGITWTERTSAADNNWLGLAYGNGIFVAVSSTGTGNRVMTSGKQDRNLAMPDNIYQGGLFSMGNVGIGTNSPTTPLHIKSSSSELAIFENLITRPQITLHSYNNDTNLTNGAELGRLNFSGRHNGSDYLEVAFVSSFYRGDGTTRYGSLAFQTFGPSNDYRMFIDELGNIGIGTSTATPVARLHIKGADDTSATYTAQFHNSTGTNNALVIRDDGNVGVGIASPSARLDVSGGRLNVGGTYNATAGSDYFVADINPMITAGANNQRIALLRLRDRGATLTGGFTGVVRPLLISENNAGGQHYVQLFETGLRIGNYSGGVATAINAPSANLELQGFDSISSGYSIRVINSNSNEIFNVRNDRRVGVGTSAPSSIFEIVNNASGTAPKSYITSYDNLSEGSSLSLRQANGTESSPTAVALLSSLGTIEAQGHTGSGWGTVGRIRFMSVENYTPTATGSWLEFATTPVGTNTAVTSMILHDSGHLAIGDTSNSTYQLNVGSSSIAGIVARFENSTGTCDINPTNTALICSSDATLKKNINTIDSSLSLLKQLRPVTYNWNTQSDDTTPTPGFIAQEVESIFPFLVTTDINTNLKSLNYTLFTPYIIKSIQELDIKVQDLTNISTDTPQTLGSLIKSFIENTSTVFERVFVRNIETEQLCIGQTCVTESQLQQLLNNSGQSTGATTQGYSNTTQESSDVVEEIIVEVSETTPDTSTEVENETTTELAQDPEIYTETTTSTEGI